MITTDPNMRCQELCILAEVILEKVNVLADLAKAAPVLLELLRAWTAIRGTLQAGTVMVVVLQLPTAQQVQPLEKRAFERNAPI